MLPSCLTLVTEARRSVREVTWQQLAEESRDDYFIVDVRERREFAGDRIPGSINVPRGLMEFTIQDHPEFRKMDVEELLDARLYLLCGTGGRSALAACSLERLGFRNVYSIAGGLKNRT